MFRIHLPYARRFVALVTLVAFAQACTVRYVTPPPAPTKDLPRVMTEAATAREGEGLVTLDADPGPVHVDEVVAHALGEVATTTGRRGSQVASVGGHGWSAAGNQTWTRPLCVTPCTVALPYGSHELVFTSLQPGSTLTSTAYVQVSHAPSVARHALGRQEPNLGGQISAVLLSGIGIATLLAGGMLLAFARTSRRDYTAEGWTTVGVGTAMTAGGVLLAQWNRPEIQPGATTQWSLPLEATTTQ
jgi:hypothetical protein